MKRNNKKERMVVYQAKSGALKLRADVSCETIWASRKQMADIFDVNPPAISKHINNIFKEGELSRKATSSKMELVQNEAGRIVKREINIYNLDMIIAVGYRINSVLGTKFRQWATKTLRNYIVNGYAINKDRVDKNYQKFLDAVNNIKQFLPAEKTVDAEHVLELINLFADTWLSLDAYDKDALRVKGLTKKSVSLTADKLNTSLDKLKYVMAERGNISDLFGLERKPGNVAGIVGNVMQTFDGRPLYPTVEEKAAHLLYFMVKNHPFVDGNKRNGAYAFIWFLRQAKILDTDRLTAPALTALTILVAESDPKEKDKIIRLILTLLA